MGGEGSEGEERKGGNRSQVYQGGEVKVEEGRERAMGRGGKAGERR